MPSLPVPDKLREQIAKDSADLAADLKKLIPEVGAVSSVGFLTGQRHGKLQSTIGANIPNWIPPSRWICSSTSAATRSPCCVGRSKVSPEGYDLLVKWIGIGYRYVEEFGLPQLKPKERAEFDKVFAQVKPLLGRLDKTTRNLLIPALADGQTGLVIDAKLTSQQFIKALPPTEQALTDARAGNRRRRQRRGQAQAGLRGVLCRGR